MTRHPLNKTLLMLLCACLVSLAHAGNRPTTPADLASIERLQRQVDRLGFSALGPNHYALSKARAWLDLALDEYHDKDRSGIVQDSIHEADALLAGLESDPSYDANATPHPYASERVRPDLWEGVEAMKRHPESACAGRRIAELEVQLVWTGHEKWESGWMHAEPYARMAENLAYEAQLALEGCAARQAPPTAAAAPLVVETRTLSTDALFAFGRAQIGHLVAGGQQKLDALAAELMSWKTLKRIDIVGHTDRLGAAATNQKLSEERAEAVRKHLVSRGLPAGIIHASGAGSAGPLVQCAATRSRQAQVECLQPNRRVELIIQGAMQ